MPDRYPPSIPAPARGCAAAWPAGRCRCCPDRSGRICFFSWEFLHSFECDAGVADYLGPALVFGPDVAGQALGRHGGRFGTDLREAFGDLTCAEHFGDRPMQGGGHRRRQVGRCDDAEPGRHVEAGSPCSATVGTSGSRALRVAAVMALALSRPALTLGAALVNELSNDSCTVPASKSWVAGPVPL